LRPNRKASRVLRGCAGATVLVLITLGYRLNAKKVLDGSIVEREYLSWLMCWFSQSTLLRSQDDYERA
jgi:hypothetical protein